MLHLIVTRHCELNDTVQLIGICEYPKSKEFRDKVEFLAKAMGWDMSEIHWTHCYVGSIIDRFPQGCGD